jgi:hypothetical protein
LLLNSKPIYSNIVVLIIIIGAINLEVLDVIIPLSVALALTVIHFIGEKISERMRKWHHHLESLGAGLMVGILFLELLPQIIVGHDTSLGFYIFIPLLAGFTIIALVEKIIYKQILRDNPVTPIKLHPQTAEEKEVEKEEIETAVEYEKDMLDIECIIPEQNNVFEAIALTTHSIMIGILVSLIFYENHLEASFIIMIPFVIRSFTVGFSTEQISEHLSEKPKKIFRVLNFLSLSFGALIGLFLVFSEVIFFIIFAFALGLVLFTVIRDMIPLGKKGKPLFFLFGIIFTIGIFLLNELVLP